MTERVIDADLKAGATSAVFGYVVLIELDFPSGILYAHNGVGTYTIGGNDYLGVGAYGSISAMAESVQLVDNPVVLTLSSITEEIIEAIRNDDIYGRSAIISLVAINSDLEITGTPTIWISGYMEKKALSVGNNDGVSITIQDESAKLRQRNNKRFTLEDHQAENVGDLFLEFLPYVQNASVEWAGVQVRSGFQNTSGFTEGDSRRDGRRERNGAPGRK